MKECHLKKGDHFEKNGQSSSKPSFFLGEKMWNGLLKKYVKLYFYRLPCLKVQPEACRHESHNRGHYITKPNNAYQKGNPWKTTIDSSKFDFPPPKGSHALFLIASWSFSSPCRKARSAFTIEPCKKARSVDDPAPSQDASGKWKSNIKTTLHCFRENPKLLNQK